MLYSPYDLSMIFLYADLIPSFLFSFPALRLLKSHRPFYNHLLAFGHLIP